MTIVAIVGLGYEGLPFVVKFGSYSRTIRFDFAVPKVEFCQRAMDASREMPDAKMRVAVSAVCGWCFCDGQCGAEFTGGGEPICCHQNGL